MLRKNQGGSILNFVVVGVVLALLLIGGAYFVRTNTKVTADKTSSPAPAKTEASKPRTTQQPSAPSPTQPAPDKTADGSQTPPATPPTASNLPETGPAETLSTVVGLGLLSYGAAAYLRSRRARAATL